eukprot:12644605-Heterocapsa_arctica.AAC.1
MAPRPVGDVSHWIILSSIPNSSPIVWKAAIVDAAASKPAAAIAPIGRLMRRGVACGKGGQNWVGAGLQARSLALRSIP